MTDQPGRTPSPDWFAETPEDRAEIAAERAKIEAEEGRVQARQMSKTTPQYVWVVECGVYEDAYVEGVYATIEAAIAANPVPEDYKFPAVPSASDVSRPGGWQQTGEDSWSNGMDWDYAARAYRMEVKS